MKDAYWPWKEAKLHLVCYGHDETKESDPDACDGTTLTTRENANTLLRQGVIHSSSVLKY